MASSHNTDTIGAYEVRTHFSALLERVENGEELTITRHGLPVARLVPVRRKPTPKQRRAAINALRALAQTNSLGGLRIKDLIAERRR